MLLELQQQWMQTLLDPHRVNESFQDNLDGGVRSSSLAFAVYVNNVRANVLNALLQTYPATATLVGDAAMRLATLEMLNRDPPSSGDLGVYGKTLIDVIATHANDDSCVLANELARFEWALDQLRRCSREQSWSIQSAAELPPERWSALRLTLTRQSMLFTSEFAVKEHREALLTVGSAMIVSSSERLLLVAGDADVNIVSLNHAEWRWLCALSEGNIEHATACALQVDSNFDLQKLLATLLALGALAQPE